MRTMHFIQHTTPNITSGSTRRKGPALQSTAADLQWSTRGARATRGKMLAIAALLLAAPTVFSRPVVSEVYVWRDKTRAKPEQSTNTLNAQPKLRTNRDLLRYAGRWYQVYQDASECVFFLWQKAPPQSPSTRPQFTPNPPTPAHHARSDVFESDYCVVADYGLFANGTISVRNRQRDKSVTGAYDGILGWAALNNRTGLHTADGSLSVYLQLPAPAPQGIPAPYDIIMLGPTSFGAFGAYEYAVVSDPFEISLFVLARDVKTYFQLYNATVFAQLEEWGFKHFINKPQMTIQDGCAEFSETDLDTCVRF